MRRQIARCFSLLFSLFLNFFLLTPFRKAIRQAVSLPLDMNTQSGVSIVRVKTVFPRSAPLNPVLFHDGTPSQPCCFPVLNIHAVMRIYIHFSSYRVPMRRKRLFHSGDTNVMYKADRPRSFAADYRLMPSKTSGEHARPPPDSAFSSALFHHAHGRCVLAHQRGNARRLRHINVSGT